MRGVNKVILIGRVGKKPEVRFFESGNAVASFPLATDESYMKDGQKIEAVQWHNVVMWQQLATIVDKYVKKGDLLYVEGKLRTRSWQDQDGNTRYITEVVGKEMTMLGARSETQTTGTSPSTTAAQAPAQQTTNTAQQPVKQEDTTTTTTAATTENSIEEEVKDPDDLPF